MSTLVVDIINFIHVCQTYAISYAIMNTAVYFVELFNIHANSNYD